MSISLDVSATGVVVFCTDCQHWARGADGPREGHEFAVQHEQNVHGAAGLATLAAAAYRRRRAARS
jgi:hypothetical protein